MNTNRKAELQRKLALIAVPKPPPGLIEQLKTDIPSNLRAASGERDRFRPSASWTLSVAASVVLLVTSLVVALRVLSPGSKPMDGTPTAEMMPQKSRQASPEEVSIAAAGKEATERVPASRPDRKREAGADSDVRHKKKTTERDAPAPERRAASMDANTVSAEATQQQAVASLPAAAPPIPTALAAGRPLGEGTAMKAAAAAPALSDRLERGSHAIPPRPTLFGLSIDPAAFRRVKEEIERGERPTAGSVDTAAVVNLLAGRGPVGGETIRLDTEASRFPLASDSRALVRFTVATPDSPSAGLVLGRDAELSISLNDAAVIKHRWIGADRLQKQPELRAHDAVTGLMELTVKPDLAPETIIATLTLRYRSLADGHEHTMRAEVRAVELSRRWESASRRHRLATLAAAWIESLADGSFADEVARRAADLAAEEPDNVRARELADLASASSRLRSSGPTGSGR